MVAKIVKLLAFMFLLLHGAFLLLCAATAGLFYVTYICGPTLKFPEVTGRSHLENCGPSTDSLEDVLVNSSLTPKEAQEVVEKHGVAIFQSVITKEAAQNLRDYAMIANHQLKPSDVHEPSYRYHVMPPHTEPTLQETLRQVAQHPVVKPVLDGLLGPSSTVMSVSLLTSEYGAVDQPFHNDAGTSEACYPDLIVPEYTLAIALQDVTREMGSTGLCPGTQKCEWPDFDWDELEKQWAEAEEDESFTGGFDEWFIYNMPCNVTADMRQGDALLYNSDVTHRGRAHTDPNAPERALLFVSFAGSQQGSHDTRSLPLGQVHALNWRMWGQTIDDLATMKERPWRLWHAFGIGIRKGSVLPWHLLDGILMIFAHENEVAHVISNDFNAEYLQALVNKLVPFTSGLTVLYVSFLLTFILVRVMFPMTVLPGKDSEIGVHMNGNGVKEHKTE